jgi:hypothetical protein
MDAVHYIKNILINPATFFVLLGITIILIFMPGILRAAGNHFYSKPFTYPGVKTRIMLRKVFFGFALLTLYHATILWWGSVFPAIAWIGLGLILSFGGGNQNPSKRKTVIRIFGAVFFLTGVGTLTFAISQMF